ncbi:MAG: RNA methyltransferase, partial [Burkholderiales bacterium]
MLVGTSHPGNVGATARAMRAMGLRRLVLVAPRDPQVCGHPDALARASRAGDVLAAARIAPTLAQALAGSTLAVAVSAETREFGPAPHPPEVIARLTHEELDADGSHRVSLVFGTERTGLSIDEVGLC